MTRSILLVLAALVLGAPLAHATPPCNAPVCAETTPLTPRAARNLARGEALERRLPIGTAMRPPETARSYLGAQILPHPAGCPRAKFCGCGAAVEVFGSPLRHLWPSSAWLRFPRTSPAPGMVAARRGHVFVIRQVLDGGRVLAYDANSGGRQTRLHVRSLAGFVVVNPRG